MAEFAWSRLEGWRIGGGDSRVAMLASRASISARR